MARPPGFDINSHQSELEHRLMELSTAFGSASGLSYLEERAAREGDDVAKACIAKLIVYARSSV